MSAGRKKTEIITRVSIEQNKNKQRAIASIAETTYAEPRKLALPRAQALFGASATDRRKSDTAVPLHTNHRRSQRHVNRKRHDSINRYIQFSGHSPGH
jgi:hypothetical protein